MFIINHHISTEQEVRDTLNGQRDYAMVSWLVYGMP